MIQNAGIRNPYFSETVKGFLFIALFCYFSPVFAKLFMSGKEFSMSNLISNECDEETGCCSCFEFLSKPSKSMRSIHGFANHFCVELIIADYMEDMRAIFYEDGGGIFDGSTSRLQGCNKDYKRTFSLREQNGTICRGTHVKETSHVMKDEDANGNKRINEYVRERKIGCGSYGKVVLYRSKKDNKQYAIKAFYKSRLSKLRVSPSETAMTDVLREVSVMKMLDHPNIVNLIEVIDDPGTDYFYMVLEYVEGKPICEGSGEPGGIGESTAGRYFRDIVAGLMYLHSHNIVHGDIKPENLLVTSSGEVKICDFSVSYAFEDDNDELQRSPGTPVFTAPECCLGLTYHGKAADTWALGITLYCMVVGHCPFIGDTLQDTYDKIVNNSFPLPKEMNPELKDLLKQLLQKDPKQRITLDRVAVHPWVVGEHGPIIQSSCRCKQRSVSDKLD